MSLATSLIDLKAELVKKKDESFKSVRDPQVNIKGGQKWKLLADKIDTKNKVKQLKAQKERTSDGEVRKSIDVEIERQLRVSREALERKTAIYEARMGKAMEGIFQDSDEEPQEEDERCLVNFDEKALEQIKIRNEEKRLAEGRLKGYKRKEGVDDDEDDDWVEFTDSLGRSRRCLRKDLKFFVTADKNLRQDEPVESQSDRSKRAKYLDSDDSDNETVEEPEELKGPIHYTDVRFNEIRDHGVGFYQLSGDSEKRTKQLNELDRLRQQTVQQIEVKAKEKEKKMTAMEQRLARIAARRGLHFKSNSKDESKIDDLTEK